MKLNNKGRFDVLLGTLLILVLTLFVDLNSIRQDIGGIFPFSLSWIAYNNEKDSMVDTAVQVLWIKTILIRGICFVSFFSFYSLCLQVQGLIGDRGLIPISTSIKTLKEFVYEQPNNKCNYLVLLLMQFTLLKYDVEPLATVYLTSERYNSKLHNLMRFDCIVCLFAAFVFPHPVILLYMYASYYSLKRLSGPFLNYQWDCLLLESLVLCFLLTISGGVFASAVVIWLVKITLFRLMFGSGIVKLFGRDKAWHTNFTALSYHFFTQPLPNMYAHWIHITAPFSLLKIMTAGAVFIEVALPMLSLVGHGKINVAVSLGYITLQLCINSTGYFGFFNLLTIVLSCCLSGHLINYIPISFEFCSWFISPEQSSFRQLFQNGLVYMASVFLTIVNACAIEKLLISRGVFGDRINANRLASLIYDACHKVHTFSTFSLYVGVQYGLFAMMTKIRNEFIVQISPTKDDSRRWTTIDFPYKPGPTQRYCKVNPFFHLPRLDWAM